MTGIKFRPFAYGYAVSPAPLIKEGVFSPVHAVASLWSLGYQYTCGFLSRLCSDLFIYTLTSPITGLGTESTCLACTGTEVNLQPLGQTGSKIPAGCLPSSGISLSLYQTMGAGPSGVTAGNGQHNSTLRGASSVCQKIMPALPRLPRAQQEAGPTRHAVSGCVGPPRLAGWQEQGARASQALLPSDPVAHF